MTDTFERIATSVPQNATAAKVVSQGIHYEPDLRAGCHLHSDLPLPMQPVPAAALALGKIPIGVKFGRFTVIGYSAAQNPKKNANWVVRCLCGNYETRKAKAIFNPANADDRCKVCRHLESSKDRYRRFGAKPLGEISLARAPAPTIEARSDETPTAARPEGRERDGEAGAPA